MSHRGINSDILWSRNSAFGKANINGDVHFLGAICVLGSMARIAHRCGLNLMTFHNFGYGISQSSNKKFKQLLIFSQFVVLYFTNVKSFLKALISNKHKLMILRNYFVAYSTILIFSLPTGSFDKKRSHYISWLVNSPIFCGQDYNLFNLASKKWTFIR